MQEETDLLLAIHVANENVDIHLNIDREVTVFHNDKNSTSFYVSEDKVESLDTMFSKIIDEKINEESYALYKKEGQIIRENDMTKVLELRDYIATVSWSEFLNEYPNIKTDDEKVATLIDKYDCIIPKDLEKIISYSIDGLTFDDKAQISLLSYDEKLDSKHFYEEELLLPVLKVDEDIVAFQCSSKYYLRIKEKELVEKSTSFEDLVNSKADIDESILNIEKQLEKLKIGSVQKTDLESKTDDLKEQKVEVEGCEVIVKQNKDVEVDVQAIADLIDDKLEEILRIEKETHEKEKVAKIKSKLELMTEKNEKAKAKAKAKMESMKNYRLDIADALYKTSRNFAFNLNEVATMIVDHLPYYEQSEGLGIIKIPDLVTNHYNLLESDEIDLGKIVLKLNNLSDKYCTLEVVRAPFVVDQEAKSLRSGTKLNFKYDEAKSFRLDEKGVMETWSIRVEKASFTAELRTVEYGKLMKLLRNTETYQSYCELEKYECKNSIMLFLYFVMNYKEEERLDELARIIVEEEKLYEEFLTAHNISHAMQEKDILATFFDKEKFIEKANFVRGLIDSNWLEYPRYIFGQHRYFERDSVMEEYINYRNDNLTETALAEYFQKIFSQNQLFEELNAEEKESLDKSINYLSLVYKENPVYGETVKYEVEKQILTNESEEDLALLISKLCSKGIIDYNDYKDYEYKIQELYRQGNLKYPIFSEKFELTSAREEYHG